MTDIIVIGAGPSGLMAAIQAAYMGTSVMVLERNDKALKKLYATGNGRCNFSNVYMDDKVYRGRDPGFAAGIIDDFDRNDLLLFFHNLGMMTKHINGYIYPYNEQARTVADVLLLECRRLGIDILCNEQVVDIIYEDNAFKVRSLTKEYTGSRLILAVGGKASPAHGSDGNLNKVIKGLGLDLVRQKPALVPLLFSDKKLSRLAGVRIKCGIALYIDDEEVSGERGEIIFNKDNLSGIPIMQVSRYATQVHAEEGNVYVSIDMFPDDSKDEVYSSLYNAFEGYRYSGLDDGEAPKRADMKKDRTALDALSLLLNEKVASHCLNIMGIPTGSLACNVSEKKLLKLTDLVKDLRVEIKGHAGWERAQVSAGGVAADGLSNELESKKIPGLYVAGELCDIDGTCGGYNLQWAFSSGAVAGRSAARSVNTGV